MSAYIKRCTREILATMMPVNNGEVSSEREEDSEGDATDTVGSVCFF